MNTLFVYQISSYVLYKRPYDVELHPRERTIGIWNDHGTVFVAVLLAFLLWAAGNALKNFSR